MSKRSTIVALVALFVFGAVGWSYFSNEANRVNLTSPNIGPEVGIGGPGDLASPTPFGSPSSAGLRISLSKGFVEHSVLATEFMQNLYDDKDTSKTTQDIENNNQEIANVIGQLGGDSARGLFLLSWRAHLKEYEHYTQGLKNNDEEETAFSRSMLSEHAKQLGNQLNQLIPTMKAARGTQLMEEHHELVLSMIEAHARGNEAEKLTQGAKLSAHAVKFANEIVDSLEKLQIQDI